MNILTHIVAIFSVLSIFHICTFAQRVPPGVNPSHYQQQQQYQQQPQYQQQQQQQQQQFQQQQQQQQPPPQYQQQPPPPPQYQQQVPVQQQQVPVQPQIQVPHQGHAPNPHHGHHGQQGRILDTQNIMQEKDHIAEHLEVPMDTSKMTEQELQFHYFKMHDADNNNKLDGCELIKSLIHWHDPKSKAGALAIEDEELSKAIDEAMRAADKNDDGFIDYREYRSAA